MANDSIDRKKTASIPSPTGDPADAPPRAPGLARVRGATMLPSLGSDSVVPQPISPHEELPHLRDLLSDDDAPPPEFCAAPRSLPPAEVDYSPTLSEFGDAGMPDTLPGDVPEPLSLPPRRGTVVEGAEHLARTIDPAAKKKRPARSTPPRSAPAGPTPVKAAPINGGHKATDPKGRALRPRDPSGHELLRPGSRLGQFTLDRLIGEGATASVWAAKHTQLGSPVAIKVFRRRDLSFGTVLGEAQAAAGIPSPNAIWVYDVGSFDGHHAIIMELCADGEKVARSLRAAEDATTEESVRWIAQAALGVEAAHKGGIFHKDIKPANILINPTDGRAQITDFGLANPALWRKNRAPAKRESRATVCIDAPKVRTSQMDPHAAIRGKVRVGTPEFMAPEQAAGLRKDLDPHNPVHRRYLVTLDVYGLGSTLYTLLAGRPPYPFGNLTPAKATAEQIMQQAISVPPLPLANLRPDLPKRLVAIVDKAMHRDPRKRYDTAQALHDDLDAWLREHPTSLDVTPLQRGLVHIKRERVRLGISAGFVALVMVSSSIVYAQMGQLREQRDEISSNLILLANQSAALEKTEGELKNTTDDLQQTTANLQQTEGELKNTTGRLRTTEKSLEQKKADLDQTRGELEALSLTHAETTQRLAETTQHLEDTRNKLFDTENTLALTQDELTDTISLLGNTRTDLADTQARLEDTTLKLSQANLDLLSTRDALASTTGQLAQTQRDLQRAEKERDALQVALDAANEEGERLTDEGNVLRRKLNQRIRQVEDLQSRLKDEQARVAQLKRDLNDTTSAYNELQERLAALTNALNP